MRTTQTLPQPATPTIDSDDKPTLHTFCRTCWPITRPGNIALCGYRSTGEGPRFDWEAPAEWPLCVVCEDLLPRGCPKCGAGR